MVSERSAEPAPEGSLVRRGILHLEGAPQAYVCADYPYYRDDPANWADRLRGAREAGVSVVKAYVPWRHHAPEDPRKGGGFDFDGRTQPNRDLLGFLDLVHEEGLLFILKPGPFVHAELPYGGLPLYVRPGADTGIEPERDAQGAPMRWRLNGMDPGSVHDLPSPYDPIFDARVRDWMNALGRAVASRFHPDGPVFALQLLNEGIYSETSAATPTQLGFSSPSVERYRAFLEERYEDVAAYNRTHGSDIGAFDEVDPPVRPLPLGSPRELLRYLDWSQFQAQLYVDVARRHLRHLVEAGVPRETPVFFNFNPNGSTFRQAPATNDGWYTRVNVLQAPDVQFGSTSWIGVVASDAQAFRQYVMANTAFRGPGLEHNWGFLTIYNPPFEYVTPSVFETMVAFACGATGTTVYTLAGTRAWRDDPNMSGEWLPARMNDHRDGTSGDYPGSAPILSDGRRTPKYWALRLLAQYARSESRWFVEDGPWARIAWAIYPPYAWAGQWLTRGDADDLLWRPPLRAVPRGAYHGLDAFVEMMLDAGIAFRQVDVALAHEDLSRLRVVCLSAFEYMDAATQERLADFVEGGGALLLTNMVPDKDERLEPLRGALAERLFPHEEERYERLPGCDRVTMGGEEAGYAHEFVNHVLPPPDADPIVELKGRTIGYRRRVGRGQAVFLGFNPWHARFSEHDPVIARTNQELLRRILWMLADEEPAPARPLTADGETFVWQHGREDAEHAQVYVVVRDAPRRIGVECTVQGRRLRLQLDSPSQSVHAVSFRRGRVSALLLKGVNDLRAEQVAPRLALQGETWGADDPCDLCVTTLDDGALAVSVASTVDGRARVRIPIEAGRVLRAVAARGLEGEVEAREDGAVVTLRDVADAGTYRVELEPRSMPRGTPAHPRRIREM